MPKEAYQCGGAEKLAPIEHMTLEIVQMLREMK
jgi:chemotaxis response regulator CheB